MDTLSSYVGDSKAIPEATASSEWDRTQRISCTVALATRGGGRTSTRIGRAAAKRDGTRVLIVQPARDERNLIQDIAVGIWLVLTGVGVFTAWKLWRGQGGPHQMVILLGAVIAGQLFLHIFYGAWFFLYSLHFAPLLILVAALSSTRNGDCRVSPQRSFGLAALNNIEQLDQALAILRFPQ